MNAKDVTEKLLEGARESAALHLSITSGFDRYKGLALQNPQDPELENIRMELQASLDKVLDNLHMVCVLKRKVMGK